MTRGPGRPAKEVRMVMLSVRMHPLVALAVRNRAKKERISVSRLILKALYTYFKITYSLNVPRNEEKAFLDVFDDH